MLLGQPITIYSIYIIFSITNNSINFELLWMRYYVYANRSINLIHFYVICDCDRQTTIKV